MFLMQRYWGSDDENEPEVKEVSNGESKLLQKIEHTPKKRKVICPDLDDQTDQDLLSLENCHREDSVQIFNSKNDISLNNNIEHTNVKNIHIKKGTFMIRNKNKSVDSELEISITRKNEKIKNKHNWSNDSVNTEVDEKISSPNRKSESSFPRKKKLKTEDSQNSFDKSNKCETNSQKPIKSKKDELNFCTIGEIKHKNEEQIKQTLPKWLSNPTIIGVDLQGKEIPVTELEYLDDNTKKNLEKAGIFFLFPVQLAVIPWLMQNKRQMMIQPSDLCVSAPTGSGKTLAFVIPIVQALKSRLVCAIRAVIVLPVSELAKQIYKVFEMFTHGTDLKISLLTGQKSFLSEQEALVETRMNKTRSLVDIIITTPGRILDHIHRTNGFSLESLQYLVIDEADRMMEEIQQGWLKQIEDAVYKNCKKSSCFCNLLDFKRVSTKPTTACQFSHISQPLQKLLYSATLSHDPEKLHTLSLYRPKLFTALSTFGTKEDWVGKCSVPESLNMFHTICDDNTKPIVLCQMLKQQGFKKVLCFTDTVERAQRLHIVLEEMGILQVREISSCNRQIQRKIVLEQFSSGKVNVLVCSDLVARGIDIEDVDCVISYDVPQFVKTHIHRMGRTARAGKSGTAITLVTKSEIPAFKKMLVSAGMTVPKKITVNNEDLKEYIPLFTKALQETDVKFRKLKSNEQQRKTGKKNKIQHGKKKNLL